MNVSRNNSTDPLHLHELEEQFQSLEPEIHDPAVKKAISLLHGMLQERWRVNSNANTRSSIPYRYVDLDLNPNARAQLKWLTGGYASHPTVYINGQVLVEPTLSELEWAVADGFN